MLKYSTENRREMLYHILKCFNKEGILYAVAHPESFSAPNIDSDIDILLGQNPKSSIEPVLINLEKTGLIRILQRLHYEVPHGYYYILAVSGCGSGDVLHLDCLYDPYGFNRYAIPSTDLVQDRVCEPWGYRVSDRSMAIFLLIKRAVKGGIDRARLETLRRFFAPGKWVVEKKEIEAWFGAGAVPLVEHLADASSLSDAGQILNKLKAMLGKNCWKSHPVRLWMGRGWSVVRKVGRFIKPTGVFVVFLGPDGSGKSILAHKTEECLARDYRRVWRFHWRPGLLPKLGKITEGGQSATGTPPPRKAAYGTFVSACRYFYYLLDFVLGYWLVINPKKAQTTLVIGERWYYDVISSPERYGFQLPRWLLSIGGYLVPRPDRVILVTADPLVIHRRKEELPVGEIEQQIGLLRKLLPRAPRGVEIENQNDLDVSLQAACDTILEATAEKTARRIGYRNRDGWVGFGFGPIPKVWVHHADSARNALRLYQPFSINGRMAKAAVQMLPAILTRHWLLKNTPGREDYRRLQDHTLIIRNHLKAPTAIISYSTGTPGTHQKLTAQVSLDGVVLAYVKIAPNAIDGLLANEDRALTQHQGIENHRPIVIPNSLGFLRADESAYLFLSTPQGRFTRRGIAIDDLDRKFLLAGVTGFSQQVSVEEVLSWAGEPIAGMPAPVKKREEDPLWKDAEDQVRLILKSGGVRIGSCHGDYAPWNTFRLEDGSLYVFDWEYSRERAPFLFDLFHRVLMPERLVLSHSPRGIVARLLSIHHDRNLGEVVKYAGVKEEELPGYILLYLLILRQRNSDSAAFEKFLRECARLVLKKIGCLGYYRKVLVSAYACEPDKGSEPGVGWNWVEAISRNNEAWVITKANNQPSIESRLAAAPNPRLHFEYVDVPKWLSFWKKGQRGVRAYYYLWQFCALRRAVRLEKSVGFDLAHHVTFVNDWLWTFLALTSLPFVWGPIGSNPWIPRDLIEGKEKKLCRMKYIFQAGMRLMDPLYWLSAYRANKIVCINREGTERFPLKWLARNKIMVEPAIGVEELPMPSGAVSHDGFSVLFVGRFIPLKGPMLALESFAMFANEVPGTRLTMIGTGSEGPKLRKRVSELGLSGRVHLVEWMSREKVLREYPAHDVFLFPSMEGGGMVVLEAMASGLPVICLDYGGPGAMVDENTGIKIPVGSRSTVIEGLAGALRKCCVGQDRLGAKPILTIRQSAQERYSWTKKIEFIDKLYCLVSDTEHHQVSQRS